MSSYINNLSQFCKKKTGQYILKNILDWSKIAKTQKDQCFKFELKMILQIFGIGNISSGQFDQVSVRTFGPSVCVQIDLLSQIARWDYQSEKITIKIDTDVIHDVEERLKKYQTAPPVDYFGPSEFIESSLDGIQILVAERLGKTAVLFGDPQKASRTIKRLMETYPNSPRMVLYAATPSRYCRALSDRR